MMKGALASPVAAATSSMAMQESFGCAVANRFHQLLDDESDPFDILREAERRKQQSKKREEAAVSTAKKPGPGGAAVAAAFSAKRESQKERKGSAFVPPPENLPAASGRRAGGGEPGSGIEGRQALCGEPEGALGLRFSSASFLRSKPHFNSATSSPPFYSGLSKVLYYRLSLMDCTWERRRVNNCELEAWTGVVINTPLGLLGVTWDLAGHVVLACCKTPSQFRLLLSRFCRWRFSLQGGPESTLQGPREGWVVGGWVLACLLSGLAQNGEKAEPEHLRR